MDNPYLPVIKTTRCIHSIDGSSKYMLKLPDGNRVEAVYIPQADGTVKVCISNQVGCVNKCAYCATGMQRYVRDMTAQEILAQLVHLLSKQQSLTPLPGDIGVLFMGMGEPMFNYDNVMSAIRFMETNGSNLSCVRSVIVSTSGVVPGIVRFSQEDTFARLAVSINAPNDSVRTSLMPINRVYSLREVLSACEYYTSTTKKQIIIEYVLLDGINDGIDAALEFIQNIGHFPCEIHLIPFNSYKKARYQTPKSDTVLRFRSILESSGLSVALKPSYGQDILGGCGQLGCS